MRVQGLGGLWSALVVHLLYCAPLDLGMPGPAGGHILDVGARPKPSAEWVGVVVCAVLVVLRHEHPHTHSAGCSLLWRAKELASHRCSITPQSVSVPAVIGIWWAALPQ